MNKRMILAAVAGMLAVTLVATPAYAQRGGRGGGRGGSWGGGGGRGWGGGGGVYRGGYGGYGGYGYGRGYGWGGYGLGVGLGLGYGNYGDGLGWGANYPYYADYPYYGDNVIYGSSNYAPAPYTYTQPMVAAAPNGVTGDGPIINGNAPSMAMQSFYAGPSGSAGKAELTVKVPANAQLWLGSMQSEQQGTERHFSFPALAAGDNNFTLRATWTDNGQTVTREKQVDVKAGANASVDFTQANDERPQTTTPKADQPKPTSTPPFLPATGLPKK